MLFMVDANLESRFFGNPVESLQIPVGNTSGKLTCEAGITGEGTVTYQWYKNNVNSNGGGTPIEGATEVTYQSILRRRAKITITLWQQTRLEIPFPWRRVR